MTEPHKEMLTRESTVPDLYDLAFMPGQFRCPKCEFQLSRQTLFVRSGTVGISAEDRETEDCPNDGTRMVHVTYREQVKAYSDRLIQELDLADAQRAENLRLTEQVRTLREAIENAPVETLMPSKLGITSTGQERNF